MSNFRLEGGRGEFSSILKYFVCVNNCWTFEMAPNDGCRHIEHHHGDTTFHCRGIVCRTWVPNNTKQLRELYTHPPPDIPDDSDDLAGRRKAAGGFGGWRC